jgi:hypothetical protein
MTAMTAICSRKSASRLLVALVSAGALTAAGCSNAGEGAVTGAGAGALAGLIIGSVTGDAGAGAAIGAAAGGVGGAVIGDQNEKADQRARARYQHERRAELERHRRERYHDDW